MTFDLKLRAHSRYFIAIRNCLSRDEMILSLDEMILSLNMVLSLDEIVFIEMILSLD